LRTVLATLTAAFLVALASCSDKKTYYVESVPTAPPALGVDDDLPGVNIEVTAVTGATGAGGSFRSGDRITVRFTVKDDNDTPLEFSSLNRISLYVSGPTFNYQRVIASQSDGLTRGIDLGSGTVSYTFAMPIPATYLAPLNDTATFTDGELTGQPLLAGTYTVGIEVRKDYDIDGASYRDVGNGSVDFRFGGASVIEPRQVVTLANCNQCHTELRAHGGNRNDVRNCVLCHTAGAEDGNNASVAGGTPDVTIEFKVMIHKLHNGSNLPSVLGVGTKVDGTRDYTVTPKPYQVAGHSLADFSEVQLPTYPTLDAPMPADVGYDSLTGAQQDVEDKIRQGAVRCDKCHGDPDGAGPLPAPSQGGQIYTQPSRRVCGSCHDDVNFAQPYTSNTQTMPAQPDDSACTLCHKVQGTSLDVMDAHLHPLLNPNLTKGTNIVITSVAEAGTHDNDGTIDPGEKVEVTFTLKDNDGVDINPAELTSFEAVVAGPVPNPNLVHLVTVPTAMLGAGPSYTINLPQQMYYEIVGASTASNGDTFNTSRTPHLNIAGAMTEVWVRTATGASSTLAAAAPARQNYIDLAMGTGASFARNDYILIDEGVGGKQECLRVQWVESDRLWFSSLYSRSYAPGLLFDHDAAATVKAVTLTSKTESTDYSLNPSTGLITELIEFGTGNLVIVSYWTDFVMPATYPGALNESPDNGQDWGDWIGLAIESGTYRVDLHGRRTVTVTVGGQDTDYSDTCPPDIMQFLVGDATVLEPRERISSPDNCYACHNDLVFHGGSRRGVDTCLSCHGNAGSEDRPRYVAANAPATTGVAIEFRRMLHKIHHGKELDKASTYIVNGFGSGYPDNYSSHSYEDIGFPSMPGGTVTCTKCHGVGNTAWTLPAPRNHPLQTKPTRVWRAACGSCHDSDSAQAHIDVMTSSSGAESCAICHGEGQEQNVPRMHKAR
jgi:OmcA/MtrC family decaheme c-type cytochrome